MTAGVHHHKPQLWLSKVRCRPFSHVRVDVHVADPTFDAFQVSSPLLVQDSPRLVRFYVRRLDRALVLHWSLQIVCIVLGHTILTPDKYDYWTRVHIGGQITSSFTEQTGAPRALRCLFFVQWFVSDDTCPNAAAFTLAVLVLQWLIYPMLWQPTYRWALNRGGWPGVVAVGMSAWALELLITSEDGADPPRRVVGGWTATLVRSAYYSPTAWDVEAVQLRQSSAFLDLISRPQQCKKVSTDIVHWAVHKSVQMKQRN
eukprot:3113060-Pyramimonas_sp.AAC.3